AFPHRTHVAERRVRDQQRHARVASAERSQGLQLLREIHPQLIASHHCINSLHWNHVRGGKHLFGVRAERRGEPLYASALDVRTSRGSVAAKATQVSAACS